MIRILTVIIIILAGVLIGVILYPTIQENRHQPLRFASDSSVVALPFVVAVEDTLFVKNRITPELIFYSDPDKMVEDLRLGVVDVGVVPWSNIFTQIGKGETLKAFMAVEVRPALPIDAIVLAKSKRAKTIMNIKGKRFGYPTTLRHYLPVFLSTINLAPTDVKLVEAPIPELTTRLKMGELDAAWLLEPYLCAVDFSRFDTITGVLTKYVTSPCPCFAVVVSPGYLRKTSKTQRMRLKIALDAAVDRIDANPAAAKTTLGRFFFSSLFDCGQVRLPEFQRLAEINKPMVQALASLLLARGVIKDTVDTKGMFVEPSQMMR